MATIRAAPSIDGLGFDAFETDAATGADALPKTLLGGWRAANPYRYPGLRYTGIGDEAVLERPST